MRSPDEYAGRLLAPAHLPQEQAQRAGHIPTAISVPWSKAANEDGTFKSDDDLRKLYTEAGLDDSKPTIAYCRIGERSSHTWFALHELLGQPMSRNYDGSWTEYGSLVGVPVALGDEPGQAVTAEYRRMRGTRPGHPLPAGVDVEKETVITGVVRAGERPGAGAYVRLLDATGEFTAEVVTSPAGQFRFFAAPVRGRCGPCPATATATRRSPRIAASTRLRSLSRPD